MNPAPPPPTASALPPSLDPGPWPGAADYAALEERISRFVARQRGWDEAAFADLAGAVYRFQIRWNLPYARYAESLGVGPEPADWRQIPAVPQQVFKRFALRSFPEGWTRATFRTSGTTGEGYGSHHFASLRLYEESVLAGWRGGGLPTGQPQLVLVPPPAAAPHSSLSRMAGFLGGFAPAGAVHFCLDAAGALAFDRFQALAARFREEGQPVLLFGTALAFLHLFETCERRAAGSSGTGAGTGPGPTGDFRPPLLPPGSTAVETGGYKGSGRELSKEALYARFTRWLGLPAEAVWNEYGMTELSSPFYARGLARPHAGPPWVRAVVVDPESGQEVPVGATGLVRLFDLANLGSVLAVQTQDLAVRRADGAFTLLGRDPQALPRGCSRAADEMLLRAADPAAAALP